MFKAFFTEIFKRVILNPKTTLAGAGTALVMLFALFGLDLDGTMVAEIAAGLAVIIGALKLDASKIGGSVAGAGVVGILFMAFLLAAIPVYAAPKTCQVFMSHTGLGADGNAENTPITLKAYNADTGAILSQANITGAVENFGLPTFTIDVPDNQKVTLKVYATATDPSGNVSAKSAIVTKIVIGADTIPPAAPSLLDMVLAWVKKVWHGLWA